MYYVPVHAHGHARSDNGTRVYRLSDCVYALYLVCMVMALEPGARQVPTLTTFLCSCLRSFCLSVVAATSLANTLVDMKSRYETETEHAVNQSSLCASFCDVAMPPGLVPATLPLNCSHDAFISEWKRTRCVLLRRARRFTRAAASTPALTEELLAKLACAAPTLEATYAAEADMHGKQAKRRRISKSPPANAAALFRGTSLPRGRYYSSFVISRQPALVSSLLKSVRGLAPPCFATSVVEEEALWFFIGCNDEEHDGKPLHGRPSHTDAVKHDGTYHRQLAGRKEWELRPTEELVRLLRPQKAKGAKTASREDAAEAPVCRIVCEQGDVLVVSTRDWWHCTRLPPSLPCASAAAVPHSISIAREFNVGARPPAVRDASRASSATAAATVANRDDEGTSFINVDGLFATARIAAGSVVLTEDEAAAGLELPTEADPNCEVCEDEEGSLVLVARRDICSGEFLSIGAE